VDHFWTGAIICGAVLRAPQPVAGQVRLAIGVHLAGIADTAERQIALKRGQVEPWPQPFIVLHD